MYSGKLEYWRNYFRGVKSSIIEIIENALLVAALDYPDELMLHRGRIAEKLYCSHCFDSVRPDCAKLVVPKMDNGGGFGVENKDRGSKNKLGGDVSKLVDRGGNNDDGIKLNDESCKNGLGGNGGELDKKGCKNMVDGNGGELEDRGCKNMLVVNGGELVDRGCKNRSDGNGGDLDKKGCESRLVVNGGELVDRGCKNGSDGNGGELDKKGCENRLVLNGGELVDRNCKNGLVVNGGKLKGGDTVGTKVDDSNRNENVDMFLTPVSMFSDIEAEALNDEIDEENLIVGEVFRIKEVLKNSEDQSNAMLFECLRKLQLMALSLHVLEATEVGKAVNPLRKHGSKKICQLAKKLVNGWRKMVDEWVDATLAAENITNPANHSLADNGLDDGMGLALPPLDVGALLTSSFCGMELFQFFDGMDDDGNPQIGAEFNKNNDDGKKHSLENHDKSKQKSHLPQEANVIVKDMGVAMKQESVMKVPKWPKNESGAGNLPKESGAGKLPKLNLEKKLMDGTKFHQTSDMVVIRKRPLTDQHYNLKISDKAAVEEKLEATRRKLHEGYQQAENAKKQRTVQLMDLHELPKQVLGHRNTHLRRKNNYRSFHK